MKKLLGIIVLSLLWSNILFAHDESMKVEEKYLLEDLLFELSSLVGTSVHTHGFFLLNYKVGDLKGIIIDPKNFESTNMDVEIKLKTGNYKKLYKLCLSNMKTHYGDKLDSDGTKIPCGYGIFHIDIIASGPYNQTIKHLLGFQHPK